MSDLLSAISNTGIVPVIKLNCPERDCRYEAKSGLGTVTVDGVARGSKAARGGSAPYKLELSSGAGDISLSFQDG